MINPSARVIEGQSVGFASRLLPMEGPNREDPRGSPTSQQKVETLRQLLNDEIGRLLSALLAERKT